MTKEEAHAILDKIRDGMPVAGATQALERLGDLSRPFSHPLRADGHEPRLNRPCETHDQVAEVGFSYSKYLDYSKTEGVTQ